MPTTPSLVLLIEVLLFFFVVESLFCIYIGIYLVSITFISQNCLNNRESKTKNKTKRDNMRSVHGTIGWGAEKKQSRNWL